MKKTDIAMIVLIAAGCVLIAFFITRSILGTPESELVTVKTIDQIDAEIVEPDASIFNANAINPTIEVQIEGETTDTANDAGTSTDGTQ